MTSDENQVNGGVAAPRQWRRLLISAVVLVAAVLVLRDKLPDPGDVITAVRSANPLWLVVALLAEGFSLRMFARQQMWLLRGFGVSVSIWRALAVTYSRSAISITMPAGSAVSAGFAYKTFRRWGASPEVAGTVMILSGLLSFAGLALLFLFGFLITLSTEPTHTWHTHPAMSVVAGVALVALLGLAGWGAVRRRRPHRVLPAWKPGTARTDDGPADVPVADGVGDAEVDGPKWRRAVLGWIATGRGALRAAGSLPWRYRRGALLFAMANWLTDLCCLAAVAQAVHLPLSFFELGTVYVVVQLVRQVPVTPGGMGVIEASLLTSLLAAGAGQAPAAAAVIGYRLFSCWLIIPVGLFAWAMLRRWARRAEPDPIEP
ncbi:flippase-like domain-containing protein [Solihabitans fulvus]|uniref:Flippase-like domain-containing protein n=1 Tax=Solihabitans fulvus TaxID=1892852 RepID=A0A5B2XVQ1_9PSEU|nr:lysylphosphatidylglycerol synthase transmembrane domain-containing protein [Solihabitans fulvus]KAA2267060.1 flippase-like domain-containing protein [Solihabitans fulvus]